MCLCVICEYGSWCNDHYDVLLYALQYLFTYRSIISILRAYVSIAFICTKDNVFIGRILFLKKKTNITMFPKLYVLVNDIFKCMLCS